MKIWKCNIPMNPDVCLLFGLLVGWSVNSVCKLIKYMYLLFAVYRGKFTLCLPFMVNTVKHGKFTI